MGTESIQSLGVGAREMRYVACALTYSVTTDDVLHRHLAVGGFLHAGSGIVINDAFLHYWF